MQYIKGTFVAGLLLLSATLFASPVFTEGQDYSLIPATARSKQIIANQIAEDPNKVQLYFFFSYGCPSCARFDPSFEKWLKSQHDNKLVIERFPVSFEDNWADLAIMYYIMQTLKPKQNLNAEIFTAIHQQDVELWQRSEMRDFFIKHGYSGQAFDALYNSTEIKAKARRADEISNAFGINETPTLIINGPVNSYLLTVEQANGNPDTLLKIASYVIAKEEQTPARAR